MSDTPDFSDFKPEVAAHIARFLFDRAQPLLIEFDKEWQWLNVHGNPARFGFDLDDADKGARQLQDLFLGMALDETIDLPFVQMPNGRSAHVHLLVNESGFQVLLLDAQAEHDRQQAQQQTGNEATLVGYQKSKAITQLRKIRTELESQRTRLQEANALKNALIATLSHDFRTPLTSIFGYLHLLERAATSETEASLRALRRNANYLFTLAENLLEYARADNRSSLIAPQAVNLQALVDDLDVMFRPLAVERGLDFTIDLDVATEMQPILDELRVRQILVNLLSNAVRYTEKGSVRVSLAWKDAALTLDIRDTGIGIAEGFHDKVFVAFNRTGQAPGSGAGLGLSIVKRLVSQLRGVLDFKSSPGEGTRFRIVLPNLEIVPEQGNNATSKVTDNEMIKDIHHVLVVDDDPDIAHLLEVLLGELGFKVSIVGDATAAVERTLSDAPDILLVDVELPGLSGNTAVFRLRSQGYKGHIVTLSATPTEEARKVAMNAGADQYLTKPINIEEFSRVMRRAAQTG